MGKQSKTKSTQAAVTKDKDMECSRTTIENRLKEHEKGYVVHCQHGAQLGRRKRDEHSWSVFVGRAVRSLARGC